MTATSYLWSRRMTTANVSFSPPKLTPLSLSNSFSSRKSSFDESKSEYSNVTTAPSSPFLYTPTEMAGILLGDSPKSAMKRCQNSKEECMRIQQTFEHFPNSSSSDSFNMMQYGVAVIGNNSKQLSELDVEIDMASLATEVALRTLDSDDEDDFLEASTCERDNVNPHGRSQVVWQPRIRLLPFIRSPPQEFLSIDDGATPSIVMSKSDGHQDLPSETVEEEEEEASIKPVRKVRARMSQEKRRRLARRREREALLLGLPSNRPSSAPAQQTKFSLEELKETVSSKSTQTFWKKNASLIPSASSSNSKTIASTSQAFPLPPHPYRYGLQKRRNSLIKPYPPKSYSQCFTISSV